MKWRKETQVYMWAHYYSEDGNWKAWDVDKVIPGGSNRKYYDPKTKTMKREDAIKHIWKLENLKTGEIVNLEFKTLKAAKQYAEEA